MNKSKGFVGLGLILAIIAVLIIGGGAYYLGTKNDYEPKNIVKENDYQPQENQNSVVNTPVANSNTTNTTTTTTCTSNTTPWIKVLSPNGGENYVLGQTINIKWDSKCISSDKLVLINIGIKDSQAVSELLDNMKVANTGSYSFKIPSNYNLSGYNSNKYELAINYIYGNGDSVGDHSDAPFTINSPAVLTTYTYTNHGFSIELPKGYIPHEEQAEGGPATIISLPVGSLSYVSNSSFWEQYNIPSYTYIKNQKIGDTTFKVYTYLGATFYWFKVGNIGYEFGGTDKAGLENLLKTFKYIGWPQN